MTAPKKRLRVVSGVLFERVAAGEGAGRIEGPPQMLLVRRADRPEIEFPGHWHTPGGKVEKGESDLEALRREMFEETGIVVGSAGPLIEIELDPPLLRAPVTLVFCLIHTCFGEPTAKEPGTAVRWATYDESLALETTVGFKALLAHMAQQKKGRS